jgi:hypothetical protein
LERARQLGQRQIRRLEREPAPHLTGERSKRSSSPGLDHEQDPERIANRDVAELCGRGVDDGQVAGLDGAA